MDSFDGLANMSVAQDDSSKKAIVALVVDNRFSDMRLPVAHLQELDHFSLRSSCATELILAADDDGAS